MAGCPNDWPLFSQNETEVHLLFEPLKKFQKSYEPIHGYLCTGICSFGVVTNLIHILILTRPNMRTSSVNVIMTAVAICDIGTMASYIIYILHFVMNKNTLCNPHLYSWSWMFFLMWHISLSIALHTASLWLAVAMAFVRLMTLRQARLYSKWQKARNAWKICAGVFAAIFLLCVPTVLSHEITTIPGFFLMVCQDFDIAELYNSSYTAYTISIPNVAVMDNCKLYKANLWLTGIIFKVVPCLLLGYLSMNLLLKLRQADKKRRRLLTPLIRPAGTPQAAASRRTDHTTILLISIVLVFLITELPQGAIAIMYAIFTEDVTRYIYNNFGDILDLLSLVNSSVNFILYSIMSSRYRQTFCHVILPHRLYVKLFRSPARPGETEFGGPPTQTGLTNATTTTPGARRKNGFEENGGIKNNFDTSIQPIQEEKESDNSISSPESVKIRKTSKTRKSVKKAVGFRMDGEKVDENLAAFYRRSSYDEPYVHSTEVNRRQSDTSRSSTKISQFIRSFSTRRRTKSAKVRRFNASERRIVELARGSIDTSENEEELNLELQEGARNMEKLHLVSPDAKVPSIKLGSFESDNFSQEPTRLNRKKVTFQSFRMPKMLRTLSTKRQKRRSSGTEAHNSENSNCPADSRMPDLLWKQNDPNCLGNQTRDLSEFEELVSAAVHHEQSL